VVLGAAVLGGVVLLGVGWRVLFLSSGVATVFVLVVTRGMPLGGDSGIGQSGAMAKDLKQGIFDALRTLKFFGAALVGVIGIFGPDAGRPPRISGPLLCGCGWHRAGERRDGGSSVDGSRFGGGRFADTAVGASARSDLPEVQRSSGVALVSGISVGAGIVAQAGDRRRVGLRQCGLVFGVEREVVLIHAGSERGRDGRGRRVGLVRGSHSAGHRDRGSHVGSGRGDVAAAGGARGAASRYPSAKKISVLTYIHDLSCAVGDRCCKSSETGFSLFVH